MTYPENQGATRACSDVVLVENPVVCGSDGVSGDHDLTAEHIVS